MITPFVTVILPTFNRENYLPNAIGSVLSQDYESLELIVVDDGSTDATPSYMASLLDSRIRYLRREQNRGIGYTRAQGVNAARGEIIAFIDSDDLWLPGKLEYQVSLFKTYPNVDLLFGDYININRMENITANGFQQTRRGMAQLVVRPLEEGAWEITNGFPASLLSANFIATSSVTLRATVFDQVGNFNSSLSGPEDFEFWWRVGLSGRQLAYTTKTLIQRDKNPGSISGKEVTFIPRYIQALDCCVESSLNANRPDLIPNLRIAQQEAWGVLLRVYALAGQRGRAWSTYQNTLRYGFSTRFSLYLLAGLAGPKAIKKIKD